MDMFHWTYFVECFILGLSGLLKITLTNIILVILLERIVANGQRIRQMPASHGLILDSSDMVFPLYKCTMTHTDYHCVACFSIVSGLMTTQHLVDWSWKISSENDRFYVSSCSSSHVIKLERQNELHYFL